MKNRIITSFIKQKSFSKFGRIIVLTGARQTGKTTLARNCFEDYKYITLEDPVTRPDYTSLSAADWHQQFPRAILDEVQKAPTLIESIKAVYDLYTEPKYLLLGSSQILLLNKIRESLSGRVSLMELFPLTLPEIMTDSWQDSIKESRMVKWIKSGMDNMEVFNGIPGTDENYSKTCQFLKNYLQFGSMPAIIDSEISSEEKYDWLHNYIQTYLQRDVRDLANMKDLEPFVLAQKTLAGLTGKIINYNNMARLSGISPKTAKRFISYLELSYQVILLQPWFRNLNKRLTKSPKLHFLDPGIQKTLLFRRGVSTGHEFESAIIAEIYKQIKSFRLNVQLYHLRTFDGREIDLLMEMEDGFVPIEIKTTERVSFADAKHLRMTDMLDKPIIHSLILSNDNQVKRIDKGITALPVAWFLG